MTFEKLNRQEMKKMQKEHEIVKQTFLQKQQTLKQQKKLK
jgi:hypothetical protein